MNKLTVKCGIIASIGLRFSYDKTTKGKAWTTGYRTYGLHRRIS